MRKKIKISVLTSIWIFSTAVIVPTFVTSCNDGHQNQKNEINQELKRINNLTLTLKENLMPNQIESLNETNILENINGWTEEKNFTYQVIDFYNEENTIVFKIKITYNNESLTSKKFTLFKSRQEQKLQIEKDRINNLNLSLSKKTITTDEWNSINSQNILGNSLISGWESKSDFTYEVIEFNKTKQRISFAIVIKNNEDQKTIKSKVFEISVVIIDSPIDINSKHSLFYKEIKQAKSPLEIITKTQLYKQRLKELNQKLNYYDWKNNGNSKEADFMDSDPIEEKNFYKLIQEIGIYGDYGSNFGEKMKYSPQNWYPEYNMTQKYLDNFENSEKTNATIKHVDIDELIGNNQFGFLPSNLSQLLYYIKLSDISTIFQVPDIKEVKANFDDEKGSIDILIIDNKNKSFLFSYVSNNENSTQKLKKNHDYRQYIYDRTFQIQSPRFAYTESTPHFMPGSYDTLTIRPKNVTGTGWVIDRIINDTLPKDHYEFLVGTNAHVLDYSYGYNKDRSKATSSSKWTNIISENKTQMERLYNDHWEGGTYYLGGDNGIGRDEIRTVIKKNDKPGHTNEIIYRIDEFSRRNPDIIQKQRLIRPNFTDPDQIPSDSGNYEVVSVFTNYDNNNLIDSVWYTPEFTSSGIYTYSQTNKTGPVLDQDKTLPTYDPTDFSKNYNKWNGMWVGKTINAGGDFAVTRIVLTKNDIKVILPTLYPLLDKQNEKDWYMGMGVNSLAETIPAANTTLFSGGYPEEVWKSIKSTGGKINAQKRFLDVTDSGATKLQTYWTRYNEEKNKKFNEYRGLVDWYKNNNFVSPTMNPEQNKKYMQHGMQIQKVLQQSYIHFSNENKNDENSIMLGGASGSMLINSRFELTGATYAYIYKDKNDNLDKLPKEEWKYTNLAMLFKNYTQENKDFSIIQQIKDQLIAENLKSLKLVV